MEQNNLYLNINSIPETDEPCNENICKQHMWSANITKITRRISMSGCAIVELIIISS